jgi:CheY-like chemotaxis protein
MPLKRPDDNHGLPTVLVAHDDPELRSNLSDRLREDGYDVLEADDVPSLVEMVLTQTRPLHLLTDPSAEKRTWAIRLRNHRRNMVVWFVDRPHPELPSDVLTPEIALATIREFFKRSRG